MLKNDYLNKYNNLPEYFKHISELQNKYYEQALEFIEREVTKNYDKYFAHSKNQNGIYGIYKTDELGSYIVNVS